MSHNLNLADLLYLPPNHKSFKHAIKICYPSTSSVRISTTAVISGGGQRGTSSAGSQFLCLKAFFTKMKPSKSAFPVALVRTPIGLGFIPPEYSRAGNLRPTGNILITPERHQQLVTLKAAAKSLLPPPRCRQGNIACGF
jgi:hypothetical protein